MDWWSKGSCLAGWIVNSLDKRCVNNAFSDGEEKMWIA